MPTKPLSDNLNLLWSSLIVAELLKNGLQTFFISPGNRNAPLISALVHEDRADKKICIDERAAGYRALGHAKATGRPGVLVCTSGTAPANYYPAVIEASRDEIPLVILSADRPPELVGSDANQTIVQQDIYGRYCRDSLYLPAPSVDYPLEALLAGIDSVIAYPNGPVHINCAFRDPLVPGIHDDRPLPDCLLASAGCLYAQDGPYTTYSTPINICRGLDEITTRIERTTRGLIVIGRLDGPQDAPKLKGLVEKLGWPVFCDIASSMKGRIPADRQIFSLDHPKALQLIKDYAPETILQFGSGLVSKHYYVTFLPQCAAKVIQISPRAGRRDPAHRVNSRILASVSSFIEGLDIQGSTSLDRDSRSRLFKSLAALHSTLQQQIPEEIMSFPRIASDILAGVPEGEGLFLGNSLVIRAFDVVQSAFPKTISVISNRGVSGIEGNIATSVGFAEGSRRRVTAVIGDISFLHDLNSLLMLAQSYTPVILIVVNNGGGRIFERLPINDFPEIIEPYMTTPHRMTFELLAAQFSLPYLKAGSPKELRRAYKEALQTGSSLLLEVFLSPAEDLQTFRNLQNVCLQ